MIFSFLSHVYKYTAKYKKVKVLGEGFEPTLGIIHPHPDSKSGSLPVSRPQSIVVLSGFEPEVFRVKVGRFAN